jgi:hypothetical protein
MNASAKLERSRGERTGVVGNERTRDVGFFGAAYVL